MKMTAFWVLALCSFVEVDRRFGGPYRLHYQCDYCRKVRDIIIQIFVAALWKVVV
jgi:hypothetical protein